MNTMKLKLSKGNLFALGACNGGLSTLRQFNLFDVDVSLDDLNDKLIDTTGSIEFLKTALLDRMIKLDDLGRIVECVRGTQLCTFEYNDCFINVYNESKLISVYDTETDMIHFKNSKEKYYYKHGIRGEHIEILNLYGLEVIKCDSDIYVYYNEFRVFGLYNCDLSHSDGKLFIGLHVVHLDETTNTVIITSPVVSSTKFTFNEQKLLSKFLSHTGYHDTMCYDYIGDQLVKISSNNGIVMDITNFIQKRNK